MPVHQCSSQSDKNALQIFFFATRRIVSKWPSICQSLPKKKKHIVLKHFLTLFHQAIEIPFLLQTEIHYIVLTCNFSIWQLPFVIIKKYIQRTKNVPHLAKCPEKPLIIGEWISFEKKNVFFFLVAMTAIKNMKNVVN